MVVIAIRHAQSLANTGQDPSLNSDLSPLGHRQVARLVDRFRGANVRAVYASPFNRCIQTAVPIAEAVNQTVRIRRELFEFHGLEPSAKADLRLDHPQEFTTRSDRVRLDSDVPSFEEWPRADESHRSMIERTRAMAAFLRDKWPAPDDVVIVVSHGSPIARLIDAWLTDEPGPSFRFVIENATASGLRFDKGVRSLLYLNEASHLSGLRSEPDSAKHTAW